MGCKLGVQGYVPWRILLIYFMLSVSQEFPVGAFSAILYKEMNLSPTKVMSYYMICYTPWLLRPVYGFISDQFPIFRYRRKPYLTLHSAFSVAVFICLALFGDKFSLFQILSVINAGLIAFCEVLVDGLSIELSNQLKRELEAKKRHEAAEAAVAAQRQVLCESGCDYPDAASVATGVSRETEAAAAFYEQIVNADKRPSERTRAELLQTVSPELQSRVTVDRQTKSSTHDIFNVVTQSVDEVTHLSNRELLGKVRKLEEDPTKQIFNRSSGHERRGRMKLLPALATTGGAIVRGVGESTLLSCVTGALRKAFCCCCKKRSIIRRRKRVFRKKPKSTEIPQDMHLPVDDESTLLVPLDAALSLSYGTTLTSSREELESSRRVISSGNHLDGEIVEIIDHGEENSAPSDPFFEYQLLSEEYFEIHQEDEHEEDTSEANQIEDPSPEAVYALVQAECMFARSIASLVASGLSVLAMYCLAPRAVLLVTSISPLVTLIFSFFVPDRKVGSNRAVVSDHATQRSETTQPNRPIDGSGMNVPKDAVKPTIPQTGTVLVNVEEEGCCMQVLASHHLPHAPKLNGATATASARRSMPCPPRHMCSRDPVSDHGPGPLGRVGTIGPSPLVLGSAVEQELKAPPLSRSVDYSPSGLHPAISRSASALLNVISPTAAVRTSLGCENGPDSPQSLLETHRTIRNIATASPTKQLEFVRQRRHSTGGQAYEPMPSSTTETPVTFEGHVGRLHGGQTVMLLPDFTEEELAQHPDDESRWEAGHANVWTSHEGQKCACGKVDNRVGEFHGHNSLCELIVCVVKQRLILLIRAILLLIQPMLFVFIVYSMPSASVPYESFLYNKHNFKNWFLTMLNYFGLLGGLLGSFLYWRFMAKRTLYVVFIFTTVVSALIATPIQYLIARGDLRHTIGIPDSVFIPFASFVTSIVTRIALMPTIVLAATNCPAHLGLESTMFSLFSSISHAASFVSYWFSVSLTKAFHVTESDYSKLPIMVIVCHCLTLAPLLFLPLVIPGCLPLPSLPRALRIAGIDDDSGVLEKLRTNKKRHKGAEYSTLEAEENPNDFDPVSPAAYRTPRLASIALTGTPSKADLQTSAASPKLESSSVEAPSHVPCRRPTS